MGMAPSELGRLRWRCRRGMKELDVLLSRMESHVPHKNIFQMKAEDL